MNQTNEIVCPHCSNSDIHMMELVFRMPSQIVYICEVCSKQFRIQTDVHSDGQTDERSFIHKNKND